MSHKASTVVPILMPRLSDSMEEAVILAWLKRPGDRIQRGEPLVEVETDKATIVYEAEEKGTLVEILVGDGESALLGAPIASLATDRVGPTIAGAPGEALVEVVERSAGDRHISSLRATAEVETVISKLLARTAATPVARKAAAEMGVSLVDVRGTGPGGRIVRRDVLAAAPPAAPRPATTSSPPRPPTRVPLSPTQRTIARRMSESRAMIPEFEITSDVTVTRALQLRDELNEVTPEARVSINDLVLRSVAIALGEFPNLNSSLEDDCVIRHGSVNIGIAVDVGDALLVPAITDADQLPLVELSAAARGAVERARARKLLPEESLAATFTISNLGMFGISSFSAVINPPQVAILAVGGIAQQPALAADGTITAEQVMKLTLCCDHRVVYGAEAARFLARIRQVLETPVSLLVPARPTQKGSM